MSSPPDLPDIPKELPTLPKPKIPQIKFLPGRTATKSLTDTKDGSNNNNNNNGPKEKVVKNTIEFTQNPLTALFLVRAKCLWDSFPFSMQCVWILAVLGASFIQWAACLALLFYFLGLTVKHQTDVNSSEPAGVQLVSTFLAATMLFIYLLGEIRSASRTFQAALQYLERDNWGYFVSIFFVLDILLHVAGAIVSVVAMATVDNISDKLQLALGFFFILEVDEWMYAVFINDFDVLDEEDFSIEDESEANNNKTEEKDIEKDQNTEISITRIWENKAKQAIRWGLVLTVLMCWAVTYSGIVIFTS